MYKSLVRWLWYVEFLQEPGRMSTVSRSFTRNVQESSRVFAVACLEYIQKSGWVAVETLFLHKFDVMSAEFSRIMYSNSLKQECPAVW